VGHNGPTDDSMFADFVWLLGVVAKVKNRRHSIK